MGRKNKANSLGRILIKDRFGHQPRDKINHESLLHTTEIQDGYDWGRLNLQSVTEESSFNEFLRTAELAGTEFTAEKLNIEFINPNNVGVMSEAECQELKEKQMANKDMLKIPRRPKWSKRMSAIELQKSENESFLEWRRSLALKQEKDGLLMTPYEKNLEFWRQLWRVVERSDVIVQIVDARNPLLFRSEDLEKYVKEVNPNKMNLILINKADFLTEEQRKVWAEYFSNIGQQVVFFSAKMAQDEAQRLVDEKRKLEEMYADEDDDVKLIRRLHGLVDCPMQSVAQMLNQSLDDTENQLNFIENIFNTTLKLNHKCNNWQILTRAELIEFFRKLHKGPKCKNEFVTTIGLVGYPNVGKSSTINALISEKKVSVSATPGKTKHYQTLYLDYDLLLCDCPGLVLPSYVNTKADMILNGILPIDQIRDHVPSVNLLCHQIARHVLEDKYGIVIAKPIEGEHLERQPTSEELLLAYGYNRGFMTANGQPDQSRSARYVLKDYVCGKLLYCHAPPDIDQKTFHQFEPRTKKEIDEESLPADQRRAMRIDNYTTSNDLDTNFFQTGNQGAHIQGRSNFPHIRQQVFNQTTNDNEGSNGNGGRGDNNSNVNGESTQIPNNRYMNVAKPWRHVKKEKRQKLRNKYAYLDQH